MRTLRQLKWILLPVVLTVAGCYSYQKPPLAIKSNDYTTLVKGETLTLTPGTDLLTEEMAQKIAIRNSPSFIATKHAMTAAWAVFYQSLSSYLPTSNAQFNVGATKTYQSSYRGPGNDKKGPDTHFYYYNMGLQTQYLIFDGLMRTMNMLSYWHSAKASEEDVKDAHRLLRQSVTVAYNNILLAKESTRIAQADLDFNTKLLNETEIKYEAGAKALIDVLNFRINATQSENAVIEFSYQFNIAKYTLAQLLGLTSSKIPKKVKFPSIETVQPDLLTDLNFYLDVALHKRPDLAAYRRRLEVAKYNLYSEWGSLSPAVYFSNTLSYGGSRMMVMDDHLTNRLTKATSSRLSYGGSVEWTLFEGGQRFFNIREAQALVVEQEFQVAMQWITVVKEVRQAYDECKKNASLLILHRRIQSDSKRYRDLIAEDYKAGNAPITELNQAQSDLIKNEAQRVQARINILNSKAQLLAAIGAYSTIPEDDKK